MENQPGSRRREDWEFHLPPTAEVREYNIKLEMDHPSLYDKYIDSKRSGITSAGFRMEFYQWKALVDVGIIKIVFCEMSDDTYEFVEKYWATIDESYKTMEQLDEIDIKWLIEQIKYFWSVN